MNLFKRWAGVDHLGHELLVGLVTGLQYFWGETFELRAIADESAQGGRVGGVVLGGRPLVGFSSSYFQHRFVFGWQCFKYFLIDK